MCVFVCIYICVYVCMLYIIFVLCILYIYIRGGSGRLRLVMSSSTLPGIPMINKLCQGLIVIVYDTLLELTVYGKTFAVVCKIHYSPENFRGASGRGHHVPYAANDSRGKLSQSTEKPRKPRKFSPSKVLLYTVFVVIIHYMAMTSSMVKLFVKSMHKSFFFC